ncbi:hypothetical protein EW14_1443 [Prochlorococcus sp. MIT 0604]|nr:hypothetical protein [Prochlorococcus sp. MIT 0604]AIQ95455.1 hypothetical protein EW14_1443 [Prochlorococcus sp. MIT 0604]
MSTTLKKIIFAIIFNSCLFFLLMIGIQNSSKKSKVKFLKNETIMLPVSFIVGSNFIFGSLLGTIFPINLTKKN